MKDRIFTNSIRNIFKSFPRFISLMVMSALGVFTFAGLHATAPDMLTTLDNYLDSKNVYDMYVISDMGLTDGDVETLSKLESVEKAVPSAFRDVVALTGVNEHVIRVYQTSEDINAIMLLEGSMPQKEDEIIVEESLLSREELSIGDKIVFKGEGFVAKEAVITGTVSSPLHYNNVLIEQKRGETGTGTGILTYYAYMPKEAFDQDYYSIIYITGKDTSGLETGSGLYNEKIKKLGDEIESIKEGCQDSRYDSIINEANSKIDESQSEADKELGKAKKELDDAKKKLDSSEKELESAAYTIKKSQESLSSNKEKLDIAKKEIAAGEAELSTKTKELKSARNEFYAALQGAGFSEDKLYPSIQDADLGIKKLNDSIGAIDAQFNSGMLPAEQIAVLTEQKNILEQQLSELSKKKEGLQTLYDTKVRIEEGESKIAAAKSRLDSSRKEYENGLAAYEQGVASLLQAQNEYESGLKSFEDGKNKYEDGLVEYEKKKEEADSELKKARDDLKDIDRPTWFINDRMDYPTYSEYIDDAGSIGNLSKVFPFLFFLVAILISLISMNRMVEDDRLEIGTLKSLGFSGGKIITKYVMFSLIATLVGAVGGAIAGLFILPRMIFGIYRILFDIPNFVIDPRWGTTLLGIGITVFCVAGTGILTAVMVLREKPADLMRPKPPRKGKRVLLEHFTLLWKRLNFSSKITIRNLFRYKKRAFVTIGGIVGCTALILIGFGMKDSIVDIPTAQFDKIFHIDGMAYLNTDGNPDGAYKYITSKTEVTNAVSTQRLSAEMDDLGVFFFVTKDQKELKKIVELKDAGTGEDVSLEPGKVVITEKLSILKKLSKGDTIDIKDINNKTYSYQISGIVKNHFDHLIYLDEATFERFSEFEPNLIYFATNLDDSDGKEALASDFLKSDDILNVIYKDTLVENADHMLKSLDEVVVILIVLAAILSFVVLYNLSNININERKRELATLKVLGFYDLEIDAYITWENAILTVIGIAGGLFMGYFLVDIVVGTIEIEKARFMYMVKPQSFIYATLISGGFTFIVNFITHFNLRRINMIESLKSVE